MQEIIVKDNKLGLRVFINVVPNLKLIPKDKVESVLSALELQISEHYKKKNRCCQVEISVNEFFQYFFQTRRDPKEQDTHHFHLAETFTSLYARRPFL